MKFLLREVLTTGHMIGATSLINGETTCLTKEDMTELRRRAEMALLMDKRVDSTTGLFL